VVAGAGYAGLGRPPGLTVFTAASLGCELAGRRLLTGAGPIGWRRLVLALGRQPNDFAIPGLARRALSLDSASDAERVWAAASKALAAAAAAAGPERQHRLATVVVGGGATGVELAGELAEILPEVASGHGLAPDRPAVQLVKAAPPSWPAPHRGSPGTRFRSRRRTCSSSSPTSAATAV
jgi:NADH dehydrogenase FAD-containing subunit